MAEIYYSEEHEWVRIEGETATVGVSDYAQEQLGDVVYVELPEIGRALKQGEAAAEIESVKAVSEVYSPISGEVVEINEALADDPARINRDAEGEGWLFKMRVGDPSEAEKLMNLKAYSDFITSHG